MDEGQLCKDLWQESKARTKQKHMTKEYSKHKEITKNKTKKKTIKKIN